MRRGSRKSPLFGQIYVSYTAKKEKPKPSGQACSAPAGTHRWAAFPKVIFLILGDLPDCHSCPDAPNTKSWLQPGNALGSKKPVETSKCSHCNTSFVFVPTQVLMWRWLCPWNPSCLLHTEMLSQDSFVSNWMTPDQWQQGSFVRQRVQLPFLRNCPRISQHWGRETWKLPTMRAIISFNGQENYSILSRIYRLCHYILPFTLLMMSTKKKTNKRNNKHPSTQKNPH